VVGLLAWVGLSAITARDAQAPPPPPPGDAEDDAAAAAAASSGWLLMMAMLLSNLSTAVSDVVVDAMVAEKSGGSDALEDDLQAFCWNALFVGGALGSAVGAVAMTTLGVPGVFLATSICPLIVAVAALSLNEPVAVVDTSGTSAARRTVADEVRSTVTAACNPAVLVPLLYIFIDGAVAPGLGTVTYFYVTTELGFSNEYLSAMGSAMWGVMLCGSLLGAAVFIPGQSSYREFMWWGGVVKIVMSLSTLVLALRLNIACGVSDEVYVGVSDAIETAVGRVLMLPFLSLAAKLTALNPGCEATLFALFMSVYNLSNTAGSYWGAAVCAYVSAPSPPLQLRQSPTPRCAAAGRGVGSVRVASTCSV
jgi:MFS family permease